jgi:hypothetical protein
MKGTIGGPQALYRAAPDARPGRQARGVREAADSRSDLLQAHRGLPLGEPIRRDIIYGFSEICGSTGAVRSSSFNCIRITSSR